MSAGMGCWVVVMVSFEVVVSLGWVQRQQQHCECKLSEAHGLG